jgi:Txe/YoeB family toxin of Txe-Axe toxin-antitoxin module
MDLKDKEKIVRIIGTADDALAKLENSISSIEACGKTPPKSDTQLLKSIQRALDILKTNPFAGDSVPQKFWPNEFNHLPNLFRMELSQFWRLLYYVAGDEIRIVSVIFEICNHKHYDKIFGYRKK